MIPLVVVLLDWILTALWPLIDMFVATVGANVMKVLLLDRGFINGPQIGRLKRDHGIDTVIPIRSDMNLQDDVRGLMKLPTPWEEYEPTHRAPLPDVTAASHGHPTHPTAKKREKARQKTLAQQRAEQAQASPIDPSRLRERTLIARFPGLTSWWDCPVPLTGVYSRDVFADGHETSWLLVMTNADWSAKRVRDLYGLRTDIEERHRQGHDFAADRPGTPGKMLLGPDAFPLHGLEPGREPNGVRVSDV